MSTADFAALVGEGRLPVTAASVTKVCREGGLAARKEGRRWLIDAERAVPLARLLGRVMDRLARNGQEPTEAQLEVVRRKLGRTDEGEGTSVVSVGIAVTFRAAGTFVPDRPEEA